MKKNISHFILITLLSLNIILTNQDEPKVALILSGGAARGYAHIPVIEMLDSLDIQIDMIVGTSIGSIVGALYASGYTGEDIYNFAFDTDWVSIFLDKSDQLGLSKMAYNFLGGVIKNASSLFTKKVALIVNSDIFWTRENIKDLKLLIEKSYNINEKTPSNS